jgi:hypothetical protein
MVFIPSLKKWVMLDPDTKAYFMDADGTILSPWEVREKLAAHGEIMVNTDIDTKSDRSFEEKTGDYKQYMAKNLFYIVCSRINTFGTDLVANQQTLYLAPKGFDITGWELANRRFRVENAPAEVLDFWQRALEKAKRDAEKEKSLISLEQFSQE